MIEAIELNNRYGQPITTVGELKEILEPFIDSCEIDGLRIFYQPLTDDIKGAARLLVQLADDT